MIRCQLCGDHAGGPWALHELSKQLWCEQCIKLEEQMGAVLRASVHGFSDYHPFHILGQALAWAEVRTGWPNNLRRCDCGRRHARDVQCPACVPPDVQRPAAPNNRKKAGKRGK